MVSNLKNNSALISTAMLSAIFEENRQDNVALLIPFVIKIIYDDSSIKENEIVEKMQNSYSFNNFPHAIAKIIINRLKKQQIIKQENGKYVFITDVSKIVRDFNERHEKTKKEIDEDPRTTKDLFVDRYGAAPLSDFFTTTEDDLKNKIKKQKNYEKNLFN